jgi:hypothetical protein
MGSMNPVMHGVISEPDQQIMRGGRSHPPGVISPLSVELWGLRRCVTETEYVESEGYCSTMSPDNLAYTSDYSVVYWINVRNPAPGDRFTWKYYRPDGVLYADYYWEYVWVPEWGIYGFVTEDGSIKIGGPWAALYVGFRTTNMPYVGQWRVEIYENQDLLTSENFSILPSVWIAQPDEGQEYILSENNYRTTTSIPFRADTIPGVTNPINWSLRLEYRTTGGQFVYYGDPETFSTQPFEQVNRVYEALGGLLTINASALINGTTIRATPVKIAITGVSQIPEEQVLFPRLLYLYAGKPTPSLMIGLAFVESSYLQFSRMTKYEYSSYWPRESYDGGSHIGLMQVETQMDRAWDWLENTRYGEWWFTGEKASIALDREQAIRSEAQRFYKYRLPQLGPVEHENMTLVCYGEHASSVVNRQYYYYEAIPLPKGKYECRWIVNYTRNPGGVDYVRRVREKADQH